MFKIRYVIYINDNILSLLDIKTNIIKKEEFKSLKKDEIINEQKFYFELDKFIRKNKIKIAILGYKLKLIINNNLTELQKEKYKEILKNYFKTVEFIEINNIFNLNKNTAILNVNYDYTDYFYMKKNQFNIIRVNKNIFNNNDLKIINHLLSSIFKPKKLIFFGNNNSIPKLARSLNKESSLLTSYSENYTDYVLNIYQNFNTH